MTKSARFRAHDTGVKELGTLLHKKKKKPGKKRYGLMSKRMYGGCAVLLQSTIIQKSERRQIRR